MSLLSVRVTLIVCTVTASPHVRSQSTRTLLSFVRLPGSPHSHFPVHCFKTAILLDIVVEIAMEVASNVQIYVYLRCSKCTHPYYCVPTLHRNFQGRMGLLSWVIIHRLHEDELPDDRKSSAVTSGELGRNEVSKRSSNHVAAQRLPLQSLHTQSDYVHQCRTRRALMLSVEVIE
ncbi:hypothetical protein CPB85DRAFT_162170 [Mucidula mucida]|nr:hypothetical protein CPB85DRAFT_162170 [Mucidula mucida]